MRVRLVSGFCQVRPGRDELSTAVNTGPGWLPCRNDFTLGCCPQLLIGRAPLFEPTGLPSNHAKPKAISRPLGICSPGASSCVGGVSGGFSLQEAVAGRYPMTSSMDLSTCRSKFAVPLRKSG